MQLNVRVNSSSTQFRFWFRKKALDFTFTSFKDLGLWKYKYGPDKMIPVKNSYHKNVSSSKKYVDVIQFQSEYKKDLFN